MIVAALLLGAVATIVIVFWKQIVEWLKRIISKIKEALGKVVEGFKTFIMRTADGLKNIAKSYSRNKATGEFEETVTRKAVEESEVPAEIRAKLSATFEVEVDTTAELMLQLKG